MDRALSRDPNEAGPSEDSNHLGPEDAAISCLWFLTPISATVSFLVVIVAMLTNQWLHTEEKMNNPSYNGTGDKDFLSKMTTSGLWMLCFTNPGETLYECSKIDYFTKEEYSPDPNDSTMAIPYAVTRSALFFLAATILLCCGYCCCLMGHCVKQRSFCTFISGVVFIIAGLIMLLGLIVYISIFKAEIGGKLRPVSQLQPPAFTYRYGYSFLLYVTGFVASQLAGVSAIFLFIHKTQRAWRTKHWDGLGMSGKLQTHAHLSNYPQFYPPCRRHPQAYINSNSIHVPTNYPSPAQRRYFFSKEPGAPESPCSVHRNRSSHTNSLKDLASFYDFPPPPPTISYQFEDHGNLRSFPRDLTANTVSTTADVDFLPEHYDDYSPSVANEHEFVTFDLDQPLPLRAQSTVSISSRNGANNGNARKDFGNDALRRTTPV